MTGGMRLDIVGLTDTGLVRDHNEDSIGWDCGRNLAVLADGMGGHSAGDVASRMAVEGILQEFQLPPSNTRNDDLGTTAQLIDHINNDIHRFAQDTLGNERMGTTLAMIFLNDDQVTICHVGDSRVYRLRDGVIELMTEDHSLVRQLIEQGTIAKEDAENSRYKNVITRALGVRMGCEAEINQFSAQIGDVYLLCSDGLSDKVSDEAMQAALDDDGRDWALVARTLVDQANQVGGEDNISVVLAVVTAAI